MARDDEFRKVAEDISALARSLGRDFRDAVDQARRGGYPPGKAVRDGLRGLTDEARRGMYTGWSKGHGRRRPHWGSWDCGPGGRGNQWWGPPAGGPETSAGGPPGPGGRPSGPPTAPPWGRSGRGRAWAGPSGTGRPVDAKPWAGPGPAARHPRPRITLPPVRHRWDASTVAGLLAVLFGVAWLIGATSILHVSIEAVVAIGLMLLGASLVVTGRTDWSLSRRSWPVWLGIALIGVLVVTSSAFGLGGALDSVTFGNKSVGAPQTAALPTGTVHGGFGNLAVDLSGAANSGTVKVVSVAGNTTVKLPADATVNVDARVVAGQICVNGRDVADGLGPQYHGHLAGTGPGPTITLHVHQVFGQILIGGTGCAR